MKTLRLAFRSILHFRMYSIVNLIGLALSLACVIIIFRYVYGELTVDKFNKKINRIYLTTFELSNAPGEIQFRGFRGEAKNIDFAKHPGVERTSDITFVDNDDIDVEGKVYNAVILAADSNFLKIIDYPVISGIENLSNPKSALITQDFAKKIFANQNPVGKSFRYSNSEILTISGIIGKTSTKSALSFDIIVSMHLSDYWMMPPQTFVLLHSDIDFRSINKQYENFIEGTSGNYKERFQLFPFSKVYFSNGILTNGAFKQGNYNYVAILMTVGILILFSGIINYINIYTVVVLRRGRELGVKKVFGAEGRHIFIQLLAENILMTGLTLILALVIVNAVQPFVSNVLLLEQIPNISFDALLSFALLFSLPLLVTLYPFLRYHYSSPVNSLSNLEKIPGGGNVRRIFLSFQYIITMVMIIVSLFFIKQLQFMLNTDPGFRTKDIIKVQLLKMPTDGNIRNMNEYQIRRDWENRISGEIVQKMNACPLFSYWTYGRSPLDFSHYLFSFRLKDGEYKETYRFLNDEIWLRLFDIKLIEGRLWDNNTDVNGLDAIIVTESFLKSLGIRDFNNTLLQGKFPYTNQEFSTKITGVVKDFNYLHLSKKTIPVAMFYSPRHPLSTEQLIAAITPGRMQEAIDFLRKLHEETVGGEFTYSFVEDEIHEMYKEDKKIATIYSVFTFIAIFVSALGLFSMSLFDMQQRRKEIAIRKVNGASFYDIIRILLKKYFWSLSISFVIATPVALFAIYRYLEDFANKATVSWWLFALALIITAGISLLTLIWQTQKAANQNPAEVVKGEN